MTRPERRTVATLAAAILLPIALFAALQAAFSMQAARARTEAEAMSLAREIRTAVDARLLTDQSALEVLSTSRFLSGHNWTGARRRFADVQSQHGRWRNVILTDALTGRAIWETAAATAPPRPWIARYLAGRPTRPLITGIVGDEPYCPCVAIHMPVWEQGAVRYVLTAELGAEDFQAALLEHPTEGVAAIVDRQGLFIARSLAYRDKLGKPATRFVRNAIAGGRSGLYKGVTYEGLKNYTAFVTSDLTGWSAHVAINAARFSGPSLGALLLTLAAAGASALLAGVIAAFGLHQARVREAERSRSAQSQKLAAIGQLASGIAHDFNNLLTVIDGNLRRISRKSADPALRRAIDNAAAASERGAKLIQQLMAFTRSQPLDIGRVDLTALLENMHDLLRQSVGRSVTVTLETAPDAGLVVSNGGQLELAILNLAVNARDAMPGGGSLTLRTAAAKGQPDLIDLEVTDTGEGMTRDVVERAMEPFFTTKPAGQGTGLGLAQVFGIVSQSGGSVDIRSRPGAGTTVRLRLRRYRDESPPA